MNDTPPGVREEHPTEEWEVPVLNVLTERPGVLLVQASAGRVVMVPPPGSGYVVPPESLPILRDALNVAEAVAKLQEQTLRRAEWLSRDEGRQGHGQ